ncbi:hypothetical protein P43SY_007995 [Pythium insidiosum]|uniref:Protein SMG9 n=1 Tax=Pythium insidiosum TaxID=114742 RepID=A0AAD5M7B5_PYTIN|nr:hypothetical protein P43SY_007995 [Pythium insidiosum]
MDREQTPLRQRHKRGGGNSSSQAAPRRAATASDGAERAFRPSSSRNRAAKASATQLTKPPLTILKAHNAHDSTALSPPSELLAAIGADAAGSRGAPLRVNTAPPLAGSHAAAPRVSPNRRTPDNSGATATATRPTLASPVGAAAPLRKHSSAPSLAPHPSPIMMRPTPLPPRVFPPDASVKLIHSSFQFAVDVLPRLSTCLDLTNFTVVGALGLQGVGKSTILSMLAESTTNGPHAPLRVQSARTREGNPFFLAQSRDAQLAARHETQGVDLVVACEPQQRATAAGALVLLDTQPILSASVLADVIGKTTAEHGTRYFGTLSSELQHELASTQLAALLLSVCHYVVVPQSASVDLDMVHFLRRVLERLQHCRLPSISGAVKDKHHAKLIFVENDSSGNRESKAERHHRQRLLTRLLPSEWLCLADRNDDAASTWVFPTVQETSSEEDVDSWSETAHRWARFVRRLPRASSFSTSARTPTAPGHSLTLKEWVTNTARVWESVKKSESLGADTSTRETGQLYQPHQHAYHHV